MGQCGSLYDGEDAGRVVNVKLGLQFEAVRGVGGQGDPGLGVPPLHDHDALPDYEQIKSIISTKSNYLLYSWGVRGGRQSILEVAFMLPDQLLWV